MTRAQFIRVTAKDLAAGFVAGGWIEETPDFVEECDRIAGMAFDLAEAMADQAERRDLADWCQS